MLIVFQNFSGNTNMTGCLNGNKAIRLVVLEIVVSTKIKNSRPFINLVLEN